METRDHESVLNLFKPLSAAEKLRVLDQWFAKHRLVKHYFPLHEKTIRSYVERYSLRQLIRILVNTTVYHGLVRQLEADCSMRREGQGWILDASQMARVQWLGRRFGLVGNSLEMSVRQQPTLYLAIAIAVLQAKQRRAHRQQMLRKRRFIDA